LPRGEPARTLSQEDLPAEWWTDAAITRKSGDDWIRDRDSLAIQVPSVPIRPEWNVLLNPLHPRMVELRIDAAQPFVFDARMFRSSTD
ncbi:MAG: RES domain-containing protein, partial [Terracidiphilus sp.]